MSFQRLINQVISGIRSWYANFDVRVNRRLKIANLGSTPTLEEEKTPEASEMSEILNRADMRVGAIESLIAKAGLRPETLGNYNGSDGLMMKDLPDIVIQQGFARCLVSPSMIIVRKTLSKARHQYFTFLTSQGTKRLVAYLNDRLVKGEVLNADSPVIGPDIDHRYGRGLWQKNKFIQRKTISNLIRGSLRPRFQYRPYVLRAYFDTQLLIAEARKEMVRDFRIFFMGHRGNIEARYTTNKCRLPDTLITEMRDSFKRSERFLDLEMLEEDPLLKQKEQLKNILDKATPDQVQKILSTLGIGNTEVRE